MPILGYVTPMWIMLDDYEDLWEQGIEVLGSASRYLVYGLDEDSNLITREDFREAMELSRR